MADAEDNKPRLTVGEFIAFLKEHNVADDTGISIEREDQGNGIGNWYDPNVFASVEIAMGDYQQVKISFVP